MQDVYSFRGSWIHHVSGCSWTVCDGMTQKTGLLASSGLLLGLLGRLLALLWLFLGHASADIGPPEAFLRRLWALLVGFWLSCGLLGLLLGLLRRLLALLWPFLGRSWADPGPPEASLRLPKNPLWPGPKN